VRISILCCDSVVIIEYTYILCAVRHSNLTAPQIRAFEEEIPSHHSFLFGEEGGGARLMTALSAKPPTHVSARTGPG
jgi:hypothetical protein